MKYAEMLQDASMSESYSPNHQSTTIREVEMDKKSKEQSTTINKNKNKVNDATASKHQQGLKRLITLYDPESMLQIPVNVARGYVTLLTTSNTPTNNIKQPPQHQPSIFSFFGSNKSSGTNDCNNNINDNSKDVDNNDPARVALAFAALTDGNVIDACFGVRSAAVATSPSKSSNNTNSGNHHATASSSTIQIHQRMVRDVKNAIGEIASSSTSTIDEDEFKLVIIHAYKNAFLTVIHGYEKYHSHSVFTRCLHYKKIQKETLSSLHGIFHETECCIQQALQC